MELTGNSVSSAANFLDGPDAGGYSGGAGTTARREPTRAELFLGQRPPPPPIPPQSGAALRAPPGLSAPQQRPPAPLPPSASSAVAVNGHGSGRRPTDEDDINVEELHAAVGWTRPPMFPPHLDVEECERRVRDGTLIKGALRVSSLWPSTAYVRPEGAKSRCDVEDFLVKGKQARNRSVHGDIVYVEVMDGVEDTADDSDGGEDAMSFEITTGGVSSDDDAEYMDDEHVLLQGAVMAVDDSPFEGATAKVGRRTVRDARVVAIADPKGRNRVIVCTLHPLRRSNKNKEDGSSREMVLESDKVLQARPTDKRMPWILLQINDVTRRALQIPGRLNKWEFWPIQILIWRENAHLPLGRLKGQCLGEAGDLQAEVKHALIEHELGEHDVDFKDSMLDEVDSIVAQAHASFDQEVLLRDDIREKRVFTIDPFSAKDLDDAIHVDFDRAKDQVEIGVHIADVGHFLKIGSRVDAEATRRTTSVYLIDRVLPMLPHGLCNHLCSLNPNEPKLSFSSYFRLDCKTGDLVEDPKPWFKKTVIRSCCRLNYDEVQDVLDGKEIEVPPVHGGHTWRDIKEDLFLLYEVCGRVRGGRMAGGAMSITKTKMIFHTRESEDGIPTDYHVESHSASHWVIEELMLLANKCVATHLAHSPLSEASVLRNHKPPDPLKSQVLERVMRNNLNIHSWEGRNAQALYRSCQEIYSRYGSTLGQCVEMMVMRAGMQQAEYFVCGPDQIPHHFALNFDHYTHFTSPIRRYPDVMVHRVLCALVHKEGHKYHSNAEALDLVKTCNDKRTAARKCQAQLDRSVFCVFLRKRKEWFYTVGTVLSFFQDHRENAHDSVTIYCTQLGKEKRMPLCTQADLEAMCLYSEGVDDQLLLPKTWNFRGKGYLELSWTPPGQPDGPIATKQKLQVLSCVPLVVIPTHTVPIDFAMFIVSPLHPKYGEINETIPEDLARGFQWTEDDEEGVEFVLADT